MTTICLVLFSLVVAASAHYDGYPFVHKNEGKYGVAFNVANYGAGTAAPAVAKPATYAAGAGVGYASNNEFNYRSFGAFPVHVGNGQFYYLGNYKGDCSQGHNYGFYFTGDASSFIMCDHGRAHRFQCPKGTTNRNTSKFQLNHPYGRNDLCGVNMLH